MEPDRAGRGGSSGSEWMDQKGKMMDDDPLGGADAAGWVLDSIVD
jgi:hypothetical protein